MPATTSEFFTPPRPVCIRSTISSIPTIRTAPSRRAYPAAPDSEYGWEKLFSERLYLAYGRNHGMEVRIARYHNIFGPEGSWNDGKEKAPAAVCRKVAMAPNGGEVEIWGDGKQTRSFLYIDECLEGTLRLMRSDFTGPVNIGSDEMVTIDQLVDIVAGIAGKIAQQAPYRWPDRGAGPQFRQSARFARSSTGRRRPCSSMACVRPTPGSAAK